MNNLLEIWKPIPGYNNEYFVSNLGNIKSFKYGKEKILKAQLSTKGYKFVVLVNDKIKKTSYIHRLVMLSFKGNSVLHVDHINFDKTDNRLINLRYLDTRSNVSRSQCLKSTSFLYGVSWCSKRGIWIAQIRIQKSIFYLGSFDNELSANKAYLLALKDWNMLGKLPSKIKRKRKSINK